jgi:uncharacterized protein
MMVAILASALLMGLVGSTHCVVMCGGVVAMTCSALPLVRRRRVMAQLPYLLAYNAGRIGSYAAFGAAAGGLGASLSTFAVLSRTQLALRFVSALMMLAVGLYVAGLAHTLRWMERAAAPLWRRVAPLAQRLVPVRHPLSALALGMLWGWMPCGLVYAALAGAMTSGSALAGAGTMIAFGLGTLPMLIAMGSAGTLVTRMARMRVVRVGAGAIVIVFGLSQLLHVGRAWADGGHGGGSACCPRHHVG